MKKIANEIAGILYDYHNEHGFQFDADKIINWVNQFDDGDRVFILEEFLYLLKKGIYISEEDARDILIGFIKTLASNNKLDVPTFLDNCDILRTQSYNASQSHLLSILEKEIEKRYGYPLVNAGKRSKKYSIYIDDIIATGNTLFSDLTKWLKENENFKRVAEKQTTLTVCSFCLHNWASVVEYRLKCEFNDNAILNKIKYLSHYIVENNRGNPAHEQLNFAYPLRQEDGSPEIEYFNNLSDLYHGKYSMSKGDLAFRNPKYPPVENFFSSKENRIRFENILLKKGIEILNHARTLEKNQRPLGCTNPTHQTLGTGTLFFLWRNIPNNCPIVFWWKSAGYWHELFPLVNRG